METKGGSDHFLEILENLEILEILEIPPVKRPLFQKTPFSDPEIPSRDQLLPLGCDRSNWRGIARWVVISEKHEVTGGSYIMLPRQDGSQCWATMGGGFTCSSSRVAPLSNESPLTPTL